MDLETLYGVKEARHKRPHIVWLRLYEMFKIGKPWREKVGLWLPVLGAGWREINRKWLLAGMGFGFYFWSNENILKLGSGYGLATSVNLLKTTDLKWYTLWYGSYSSIKKLVICEQIGKHERKSFPFKESLGKCFCNMNLLFLPLHSPRFWFVDLVLCIGFKSLAMYEEGALP